MRQVANGAPEVGRPSSTLTHGYGLAMTGREHGLSAITNRIELGNGEGDGLEARRPRALADEGDLTLGQSEDLPAAVVAHAALFLAVVGFW
jgi:hypothetical protein